MKLFLKNISPFIPIPNPRPFSTFFARFTQKWMFMLRFFGIRFGLALGITGAKSIGYTAERNAILRLNRNGVLGPKGSLIHLPKDKVIFWHVRYLEEWEIDESKFIAKNLARFETEKIALIDIGANTGLVSLQALNLVGKNITSYLFEPITRHVEAIKLNLNRFSNIEVFPFALSDRDENSIIFTEVNNHANSSTLRSVVPVDNLLSSQISLVETTSFAKNNVALFENYVLKCDTQGMDALILSRLPDYIWENTISAVIEVWALPEIQDSDVDNLLKRWSKFNQISWNSDFSTTLTLENLQKFWLGKSGLQKNLFLNRR